MSVVGIFSDDTAKLGEDIAMVDGLRVLRSLTPHLLKPIDCLLVDVRFDAESTLKKVQMLNGQYPVIALSNKHTRFPAAYPFGCHLHDHTTPEELGSPLFWHRVSSAIDRCRAPLSQSNIGQYQYALLQAIVDHSSDWIFVKDLEHRFLVASESFARVAGYALEDLIGKDDLEIGNSPKHVLGDPDSNYKGFWPQDDAVTQSGNISIEENPHWDLYSDSERYRRTIRVPLKGHTGEVYALLVSSQDVTDEMKKEALLADRTKMLDIVTAEKQLAEKSQKIAEEAVAAKARFLAAASHDLRQPLHAMGLFLDILNTRMVGDKDQHLVQQIKNSCAALSSLFNGCLDISRLDAGVIERLDTDFTAVEFIESLSDEFRQQAKERQLDYQYDVDDSVLKTDSMLLARIVRNLVNNAIDNTSHGQVLIRCKRTDAFAQLSIIDTGSGIPEQDQKLIFQEFHQLDGTRVRHGKGLGLGLAIVKRLCDLLEIKLELNSEADKGSSFTLYIPIGKTENIVFPASTGELPSLRGTKLVIIDDDPSILIGMEVLLHTYGCETIVGPDAPTVINACRSENSLPDVIIADYHLGTGGSGTRAVDDIRDALGYPIPAVLVTGDTSDESEQDAADRSMKILFKPVASETLIATIAGELTRKDCSPN